MPGRGRLGFGQLIRRDDNSFGQWVFLQTVQRLYPDAMKALASADLAAWLDQHHLQAPWIEAHARSTLRLWARLQKCPRVWADRDDLSGHLYVEPLPAPTYDPFLVSRDTYLRQIDEYVAECEGRARAAGGRVAPKKDPGHFELLARFQVGEEEYVELARTFPGGTAKQAREAIVSLARFIELPLRPAKRGGNRRQKSKKLHGRASGVLA